MNKELQILNINGVSYDISDKKAREDLYTIKAKEFLTNATLKGMYTEETKTLTLSLETTKGGFM